MRMAAMWIASAMGTLERPGTVGSFRFLVAVVPLLCGLVGVFIANIPVSLLGGGVPPPLLGLVPVYFWCLVRPDLMTPSAAFAIGLAEDVLSGGPPGVWTLAFVLTYAVVARQRDSFAGLSGLAAVVGFAAASAFASLIAYLITAALNWHLPLPAPILSELAMTVLFYVPAAFVVGAIHRGIVGPMRSDP
jgi:rod shape-determining protein MreD